MVARARQVAWTESALRALDEVLREIAKESEDGATRVLRRTVETAASLATFAERGRVVPEIGDSALRELFVYDYRLLYRVGSNDVVIRAFLHGARDFKRWRRNQAPEL